MFFCFEEILVERPKNVKNGEIEFLKLMILSKVVPEQNYGRCARVNLTVLFVVCKMNADILC